MYITDIVEILGLFWPYMAANHKQSCTLWFPHRLASFPGLPTIQFFDRLQYAKTGGGRPGPFYYVNNVSVYLGRQRGGGVPRRNNELDALSCSFCPKHWSFECLQSGKHTALGSKRRTRTENVPFWSGTPLSVYCTLKWTLSGFLMHLIGQKSCDQK